MAQVWALKMDELSNIVKYGFRWMDAAAIHRIPEQLSRYGFQPNDANLHLYAIVALHPLANIAQEAGMVDFPEDLVMKATYTAIGKGANINHDVLLQDGFITVCLDAEYEHGRQEYVVASNDPEIFRLTQEGAINSVSIQGKPRLYVENCGNCSSANCQCKLVPEGLVLGYPDEDPLMDNKAFAFIVSKDSIYHGQQIKGVPPADKGTSVTILMSQHLSTKEAWDEVAKNPHIKNGFVMDVDEFKEIMEANKNAPPWHTIQELHKAKSLFNPLAQTGSNMSTNPGPCGQGEQWDAVQQKCIPVQNAQPPAPPAPAANAGEPAGAPAAAPTGAAPAGDPAGKTNAHLESDNIDDIKKLLSQLSENLTTIQNSIADKATKDKNSFEALVNMNKTAMTEITTLKTELKQLKMSGLQGQPGVELSEFEKNEIKKAAIQNTSLAQIVAMGTQ